MKEKSKILFSITYQLLIEPDKYPLPVNWMRDTSSWTCAVKAPNAPLEVEYSSGKLTEAAPFQTSRIRKTVGLLVTGAFEGRAVVVGVVVGDREVGCSDN